MSTRIIDKDALMNTIDHNADILKELIRLYLDSLPKLMSGIREGISEKDGSLIEQSAHALKGMSYNISAHGIAAAALELEKIGRSNDLALSEERYAVLEKEASELEKVLAEISNNAG